LWLRWAAAVLAADLVIHFGVGLLVNDWEGWAVAAGTFLFVLVTGLVIVGLTFGLLVRWALKPSPGGRNRAALAALPTGVASLAAYAIFFTWAPVLIAPAALLLAWEGLRAAGGAGRTAIRSGRRCAGRGQRRVLPLSLGRLVCHRQLPVWLLTGCPAPVQR
jgi:hypothetical protein